MFTSYRDLLVLLFLKILFSLYVGPSFNGPYPRIYNIIQLAMIPNAAGAVDYSLGVFSS